MSNAEQERAEARINKANIIAWLKHMIERNETMEADGEASAYKFTLGRIEDGKFDINSLDREEQLIAENERITKDRDEAYSDLRGVLSQLDTRDIQLGSARTEVAEQDKEIQRLREALISERDEAMKWDGVGTVNRINKTLNQS